MNKKWMLIAFGLVSSLNLLGQVGIRTSGRDVHYKGTCEQGISIVTIFDGEAFPGISPENPAYVSITLDKGAVLCQTLVWTSQDNPNTLTQNPIYLPVSFETNEDGVTVTAAADAVSIVRWKAGESAIWLKIQSPVSSWLSTGIPNDENRLSFSIGFDARDEWGRNSYFFQISEANLPCTTRNIDDVLALTRDDAVSVLLCFDFSGSSLKALPWSPRTMTVAYLHFSFWDGSTQGVDGPQAVASADQIVASEPILMRLYPYNPISQGTDKSCQSSIPQGDGVGGSNSLCGTGLVAVETSVTLDVSCPNSWGWHVGSELILQTGSEGSGFRIQIDGQGQPVLDEEGRALLDASDFVGEEAMSIATAYGMNLFTDAGGNLLARDAHLVYDGPNNTSGSIRVGVTSKVYRHPSESPQEVSMSVNYRSSNRDPDDVIRPFDGIDQARHCSPGLQEGSPLEYATANFEECAQ